MADFLIMAINKTHSDPLKEARECYQRGDIVEVFEHGKLQTPPIGSPFVLVRVTGVTKAQADNYMAEHRELIKPFNLIKRRIYNIDYTLLPLATVNKLRDNRFIEVTLTQVRNYIRNKTTGVLG